MAKKTAPDKITKLYNGECEVHFWENPRHEYYIGDKKITGVTTYLGIKDKSGPLVWWAVDVYRKFLLERITEEEINTDHIHEGAKQHTIKKDEAADIGTKIHAWIDAYAKGQNPEMPEENAVILGVNAFMDWVEQHKVKILSSERMVYSKQHNYIGTMDIEAEIDGKRCLVDIKTGNSLYNSVNMQTAAYAMADYEETGKDYDGRWAIRLSKETKEEYEERVKDKKDPKPYQVFEAVYLDEKPGYMHEDFQAFLLCKNLFEYDKKFISGSALRKNEA